MANFQIHPAPRIDFGKVVHRPGREGNYFFAHSMNGYDFYGAAHHNRIDGKTMMQIKSASMLVQAEKNPKSGPFSDKNGAVAALGKIIFDSCKSDDEKVARLIAIINDDRFFRFYPELISEDRSFSTHDILSQDGRIAKDTDSGECARLFGNIFEPYFFGVSLLRYEGITAFPAFGILHAMPKEEHSPIIAILDPDGPVPLRTISLLSMHPPMHHLAILSDRSSYGLTYVMLAENRMKVMLGRVMEDITNKRAPRDGMLSQMSDSISDSLLCSHLVWPNNLFIGHSIKLLGDQIFQRLSSVALSAGFQGPDLKRMLESAAKFSAGMMCRIEEAFEAKKQMRQSGMLS